MKRPLSLAATLLAVATVCANDAVYYTSGNQLIPLNETDISIRKEILTITMSDKSQAVIDVYYEFENTSQTSKTITMGFEADPPYDQAYEFHNNSKHPNIYDFTVEFNGNALNYRNAIYKVEEEGRSVPISLSEWKPSEFGDRLVSRHDEEIMIEYAYVYLFEAVFQPGINRVHHTYSYDASCGVGFEYQIEYKLSPALRWANHQIDDFTLIIRADNTAKYFDVTNASFGSNDPGWQIIDGVGKQRQSKVYEHITTEFSLRNSAIVLHRQNYRPEAELYIFSADNVYNETPSVFGSYYSRSSVVGLFQGQDWETGAYLNEPKDPAKRKRIAHNLPYASRGHVFKNKEMKAYFESLWWYIPDPDYVDDPSKFTKTEQDYLKF